MVWNRKQDDGAIIMKDRVISEQMLSPGQQPPKIEFPCEYPIKVLGHAVPDFDELVFKAVKKHAPELTQESTSARDSRAGTFRSVTVVISAQGKAQIDNIFVELKKIEAVKVVF